MTLTVLAILFVLGSMTAKWFGARGRLRWQYRLWLGMGVIMVTYNCILALTPGQLGCAIMIIPSGWTTIAGVIGLRRLKRLKFDVSAATTGRLK